MISAPIATRAFSEVVLLHDAMCSIIFKIAKAAQRLELVAFLCLKVTLGVQ